MIKIITVMLKIPQVFFDIYFFKLLVLSGLWVAFMFFFFFSFFYFIIFFFF